MSDCNNHGFIFQNKLIIFENLKIQEELVWFTSIKKILPTWQPDKNAKTIIYKHAKIAITLKLWNNIACCVPLVGTITNEICSLIIEYLTLVINTNIPDARLAKEANYKVFFYLPLSTKPTNLFRGTSEPITKTILGDPLIPGFLEWKYNIGLEIGLLDLKKNIVN